MVCVHCAELRYELANPRHALSGSLVTPQTVAGSTSGYAGSTGNGGPATSALLASPVGVTCDTLGNLFIADFVSVRRAVRTQAHVSWCGGRGTGSFCESPAAF